MEFPVTLFLDPQNHLSVLLCFSDDPSLHFSFADADGSPIAKDPLTSFASVEFRDDPPRHIVFSGGSVTRSIIFETDEDFRRFLDALGARVMMNAQESNPSVLSLVHEPPKQPSRHSLFGHLIRMVPDLSPRIRGPRRPVDGIVSGAIDVSVLRQALFKIEAAGEHDLKNVNWAVLSVADDDWPAVFGLLLDAPRSGEYENLSQQWRSTIVDQWKRHFLLRKFVAGLDNWLSHSQLPSRSHKQAFFNVVMGLFTDSFGTLVLDESLLFVCEFFFKLFVRNSTDDGAFVLATGEVLPQIETEAFVFAHIEPIIQQTRGLPNVKREAAAIFT
jgi:hypothetical protein